MMKYIEIVILDFFAVLSWLITQKKSTAYRKICSLQLCKYPLSLYFYNMFVYKVRNAYTIFIVLYIYSLFFDKDIIGDMFF